jgi:hypothetical protein
MENILNYLQKKNLQPSSIKLYLNNLKRLNDDKPVEDLAFLGNINDIIAKISHYKPTTQRNNIITICSVLKHFPDLEPLYKQYYDILLKCNEALKNHTDKTEQQLENWISQDEVMKIYTELTNKTSTLFKKKSLDKKEYDLLLDWIILSLYVLVPPRRILDYLLMVILPKSKKFVMNNNYNYIDLKNKKFIFNNYKTSGTYNQVVIDIPDVLFNVIITYLKFYPNKNDLGKEPVFLLSNYYGENLSQPNMITKILNKIFGKKISVSMLRNIYLSSKYSNKINELENDVAMMGTSSNTALNNYIKKD